MPVIALLESFGFACPFCRCAVLTGRPEDAPLEDGEADSSEYIVLHALPLCSVFAEGDALAYLRKVKQAFLKTGRETNPCLS